MIHSATAFVVVLLLLASCLLASVTAATTSLEKKVIDFVTITFDQAPSIKRVEDAARRKNPDRGIIWRFLPPPGFFVLE
jgi:hypothetical protein